MISVVSAMPSSEIMVEEALCGLLNPQKHRGPTSLRLMTYASINPEAGNELDPELKVKGIAYEGHTIE